MIQTNRVLFLSLIVTSAALFTGCETAEQKPAKTAPPAAAMAPAIQQPSAVHPIAAPVQATQQQSNQCKWILCLR